MASRRRAAPRRARRRGGLSLPRLALPNVGPEVARSIIGIILLVLGAVTLIALILPGQGRLTDWWIGSVGPWFGSLRWLLPFLLLGGGWYLEWGPGRRAASGWGVTIVGIVVAYLGILGAVQITGLWSGGRLGRFWENLLVAPLTAPGAFVLLVALAAVGLMLAFNLPLRELVRPGTALARWLGSTAAASVRRVPRAPEGGTATRDAEAVAAGERPSGGRLPRGSKVGVAASPSAGQTGIWGEEDGTRIPSAVPSTVPTSATFAPARNGVGPAPAAVMEPIRPLRDPDDITSASDSPPTRERREYVLPPLDLLDEALEPIGLGGEEALHRRNEEIIVRKLASFDIPAQIVGRNAGPVVTQYEVQPAPHVKVSRIEALADDLAMALAARSLRIEAPIPGKSAVGIELPNKDFNIVALRGILESVDFAGSSTSRLTFALGRDVAGKAQAVDLAKMPHL
ncbi:MAG TPA: DNA translocase FtsK, partial [Candidatus Sulfomarinibacteraceae bacterium]|nr:DNA translocase FtsK [Candidatus Sulfomarinibacteraceae bacterium]